MEGYIGQLIMFAGNFAPNYWAFCEGQLLAISQNTALFSILGTTYGGDGRTTFALPDFRGRVPIHQGNGPGLSPHTLGEKSGTENVTLQITQLPSHNHPVAVGVQNTAGNFPNPGGNYLSSIANGYSEEVTAGATLNGVTSGVSGGNQPHSNMQPYCVVNMIICLQGIFPSRS